VPESQIHSPFNPFLSLLHQFLDVMGRDWIEGGAQLVH
jgi:hypothetical protein